ncbi:unnamed protein product [Trifolium pratense]|uniref:Uncharacterized protein n=1 Tax=Trifolium pratense TaxID=57577 RepID=A0ACB0JE76_TRIPR|nr:unnamed protein product [Trifolium pratense]
MKFISAPPFQLVSIVGIVMFLLFVPSYINFKSTMHKANITLHLFLMILPLLLIFIAYFISKCGPRFVLPVDFFGRQLVQSRARTEGGGSAPWGLAALVVLLLVLASKLSNFRSMWSPLIWRPN